MKGTTNIPKVDVGTVVLEEDSDLSKMHKYLPNKVASCRLEAPCTSKDGAWDLCRPWRPLTPLRTRVAHP